MFPTNPYENDDQPLGEPEQTDCQLGLSPHCTPNEGSRTWQGQRACVACYTLCEQTLEAGRQRERELGYLENLWARR